MRTSEMVMHRLKVCPEILLAAERMSAGGLGESMDALATKAVEQGLLPAHPPVSGEGARIPVYLPREIEARWMKDAGPSWDWRGRFESYALAGALKMLGKDNEVLEMEIPEEKDFGIDLRKEQREILSWMLSDAENGRIGLIESATGTGKSRCIALAAREIADRGTRVIVAAPTLQILSQIGQEWSWCSGSAAAVRLGKSQFVDPERLVCALDDLPQETALKLLGWIQAGGRWEDGARHPWADTFGIDPAWLWDDIADVINSDPEISMTRGEVILQDGCGEENPAHVEWKSLARRAGMSSVIFTTHATLALDMLFKAWGRPQILGDTAGAALLMDEAHLFPDVVESILGGSVSAHHLCVLLREELKSGRRTKTLAKKALSRAKAWRSAFQDVKPGHYWMSEESRNEEGSPQYLANRMLQELAPEIASLADKSPLFGEIADRIGKANDRKNPASLYISKEKRYPRIVVGPGKIERYLENLWKDAGTALLLSGTLYVIDGDEKSDGSSLIRRFLSIPEERVSVHPVVRPSWTLDPVTLHRPAPGFAAKAGLRPPKYNEDDGNRNEEAWLDAVTRHLCPICEQAVGGTLVLLSSYSILDGLARRTRPHLGDRLVVQQRGEGIRPCLEAFREKWKNGLRPVWLGTGPCWVGLDLSDPDLPPEEDFMLSDLVIPKIRFPDPHSPFRIARGRAFIGEEAQFILRQAVGRLVRRKGNVDRGLWILDPRPWLPTCFRGQHMYRPAREAMQVYRKHDVFLPIRQEPRDDTTRGNTGQTLNSPRNIVDTEFDMEERAY